MQAGRRIAHFEVVGLVGSGGMGEVYRARDTRLGRDVAIKVLPAEFAADPERLRRFEQEARAVAALDHPNILAIHDVGTHEGAPYIVTELLEGESLQRRLRSGALPVGKAVEIGIQIAQGLAAAHERGVVHRDLKPGNLFVTRDGTVKILDFGIAKLAPPRTPEQQAGATTVVEATGAGTVLGTIGYMSPEQVRGQAVDQRSDIFSFGCVFYETLSGKAPFARATEPDTSSAILHEDPPPLTASVRQVPPALEGVVRRCLEKVPDDRFSSAHDVALALRLASGDAAPRPVTTRPTLGAGLAVVALAVIGLLALVAGRLLHRGSAVRTSAATIPRVAVIPFENLGRPEDAYFASGMAEEITSRLANVRGLGVISRTTAFEYDRRGKTVRQIGGELGVDYVLEGTVRWQHEPGRNGRVRITPQLIRVADDTHVWADSYDRELADVFAIQSDVAENAVRAMNVVLLPQERTALRDVSTNDLEAYDYYLRGQGLSARSYREEDIRGALQMYQRAAERDPGFAQALAGLARMNLSMHWERYDRSPLRISRAKDAAERAVELRPDLPETHAALGWYLYRGLLDYPRALDEFARALKIRPRDPDALLGSGAVLRRQGRWDAAAEMMRRAIEADPRSAATLHNLAQSEALSWQFAAADETYGRAIAANPVWGECYALRAWLQVLWKGDLAKAQAIIDEAAGIAGLNDEAGHLVWARYRVALARREFGRALRQLASERRPAVSEEQYYVPLSLLRALAERFSGHGREARAAFDEARLELESKIALAPDDARFRGSLGIAYAGLGRREDAVREARLACTLMPASRDALNALHRVAELAAVYAMVGRTGEAIATLDDLLGRSGDWSHHVLRLDPTWEPLRPDPRFQALLAKYEVTE